MEQIVLGKTAEGRSLWTQLKILLRTRLLIQANSGGGKSWLLRLLAELLFGKVQVIIIDREGEFASLRPKFGYLLVGQVSEGADIQADVRSARLLAEKVLELGVSTICDLYEAFRTNPSGRRAWVAAFLEGLIDAPKSLWHDCVIIVDEAHQFCPESLPKAASMADREIISRCKEAMVALATVGRKRGFCAVWATQRLAKLDKDASAELFNRLVGMTIEDVDVDRAVDLMSVSREDKPAFRKTVRELEPGNFFAFGRAITKERLLFKVGPVATKHQEAGSKGYTGKPPPVPQVIKALLPQLADLAKQSDAKAKTEAELRLQVKKLEAQLQAALRQKPAVQVPAPVKTVTNTVTKVEMKTVEVPILQPAEMKRVEAALVRLEGVMHKMDPIVKAEGNLGSFLKTLGVKLSNAVEAAENFRKPASVKTMTAPVPKPALPVRPVFQKPAAPKPSPKMEDGAPAAEGEALLAGERKMLGVLAQFHPGSRTKSQLGALSGYTPSGGTFGQYYGKLKRLKLIREGSDGGISITEAGLEWFGGEIPEGPKSPEELLEMWRGKLLKGERKMLDTLVQEYPNTLTKEELGERSGYESSGGTFGQYFGTLRRNALILVDGDVVKAAETLFDMETASR